jgi:hypothetical protein
MPASFFKSYAGMDWRLRSLPHKRRLRFSDSPLRGLLRLPVQLHQYLVENR